MKRIIEYIKSLFKCRHLVKECINVEIKEDVDGEKNNEDYMDMSCLR